MLKIHESHSAALTTPTREAAVPPVPNPWTNSRTKRYDDLLEALDRCRGMKRIDRLMLSVKRTLALAQALRQDFEVDGFTGECLADQWAVTAFVREFTSIHPLHDLVTLERNLASFVCVVGSELGKF